MLLFPLYFSAHSGTKKQGIRAFDGIPGTMTDPSKASLSIAEAMAGPWVVKMADFVLNVA